MNTETILFFASLFLLLSVLLNRFSSFLKIPTLLIFLGIGMIAGSEGLCGIYFDDYNLAQSLGVIALIFILFSGALNTNWEIVQPVWRSGIALSTIGVILTALLVGLFAHMLFDFTLLEGLLLGSIVSSTDAAAVFSTLRSKNITLQKNLKALIEFESASNDPTAVALTIGLISLMHNHATSMLNLVFLFFLQMIIGIVIGMVTGRLLPEIINRISLEYKGLYSVLTIGYIFLIYAMTTLIKGNGFLAVYIAGLVAGNRRFVHRTDLANFHDAFAWLMQVIMFITLGLLVFPTQLIEIKGQGILISLFLMIIARPVSVFFTLFVSKFKLKEIALISWVGLRGAVPIILATFPLQSGIPKAQMIFNIVFFIVITSVLIQGTTLRFVAKWLKVER